MNRVFSGIQPTGELHIGNYLGAIRNWVKVQEDHECIYCVVDYHALTVGYEVNELRPRIRELAAGIMACGVDPNRSALFVQSEVPAHTELAWVFTCVTPMGELSRQTQFKSKSEQNIDNINAGLFTYPVLQAADILLYKANRVPVGQDQEQHLELCREIARRFNARFGETFPEAHTMFSSTPKIRGLDGKAKMSKSLGNSIAVNEEPEVLRKKLSTAFTDPNRLRKSDPGNPEVCNVYSLHGYFTDEQKVKEIDVGCRAATLGCVDCKKLLCDGMTSHFAPIREKWAELRAKPALVDEALDAGAARCRTMAQDTMREVHLKLGLRA
ncbi:MAG: tryptophan--tRNA ligase [Deltaproteobacteria bacterium]|nr:tryptophan--tRNA ligase [Deltaproteobacteria bacterium]